MGNHPFNHKEKRAIVDGESVKRWVSGRILRLGMCLLGAKKKTAKEQR